MTMVELERVEIERLKNRINWLQEANDRLQRQMGVLVEVSAEMQSPGWKAREQQSSRPVEP